MNRPTFDEYFMEIVEIVKKRSTCLRRQVGAIIVRDNNIIATGYNGSPKGVRHCDKNLCLRENANIVSGQRHELCRGTHAEQNAIIQAAVNGTSIKDATIYVTHSPCILCSKMLINAGIEKIIYKGDYPDSASIEILKEAGVEIIKYEDERK